MGPDPNKWFQNVEIVAAREIGRETVDYVAHILMYYVAYDRVVARDAQQSQGFRPLIVQEMDAAAKPGSLKQMANAGLRGDVVRYRIGRL